MKNHFSFALLLILFAFNQVSAQESYTFITSDNLDTLSNYKLVLYQQADSTIYLPKKDNRVHIHSKKIKEADSIFLYFDYWYKEKISKKDFDKPNIYVDKQLYLKEVVLEKKIKEIGSFNEKSENIREGSNLGSLVGFQLGEVSKISAFKILISNKKTNSSFIPVLFIADSLHDPNKIHIYPDMELFTVEKKTRNKWLNIPIEEYSGPMKSKIYAGYFSKGFDIVFKHTKFKSNTYFDSYSGGIYRVGEKWSHVWSTAPIVKIILEE